MKNKKILLILACLAGSLFSVTGCDNEDGTTDIDGDLKEVNIASLYDGMVAMYQSKNYTFEIVHTYGSYREEIPNKIFTEKYIGFDGTALDDLDILYNDDNGIYRVSFTDDYKSGEYLKDNSGANYNNLWNNSVTYTMYGMGGVYIKKNVTSEVTSLKVEDKDYKLRFMQTIIGSTSDYANIDSLNAKFENGKVTFTLSLGSGAHIYKVSLKDVGITKSAHLKTFIKNGGSAFAPNKDLSEMRRLINLDNFVQRTYSVSDGEGYFSGNQYFTEHYFLLTTNSSTGYAYMEFDYKEKPEVENDFDMWGIYMINLSVDESGQLAGSLASSHAYNSATNEIEECCNYPSRKLSLLKNLEYVKSGDVRNAEYIYEEGQAARYYFIDENIVNNFVSNFSLNQNFADVVFNTIAIEIATAENDKDSVVCFHAIGYYPADGMTYDILIPFIKFGDANSPALDNLYNQYNK